MGMRPFEIVRKGEAAVKSGEVAADTPDDKVIDMIVADPNLLQRPIIEIGDKAVLARPVDKALELLKSEGIVKA
jgi:arsenate reductase (glutaredoxin)